MRLPAPTGTPGSGLRRHCRRMGAAGSLPSRPILHRSFVSIGICRLVPVPWRRCRSPCWGNSLLSTVPLDGPCFAPTRTRSARSQGVTLVTLPHHWLVACCIHFVGRRLRSPPEDWHWPFAFHCWSRWLSRDLGGAFGSPARAFRWLSCSSRGWWLSTFAGGVGVCALRAGLVLLRRCALRRCWSSLTLVRGACTRCTCAVFRLCSRVVAR